MAKESRRVRRMQRHYERNKRVATLNIVALIDIFTVMLFFLLMYTDASSEIVPIGKNIKLPESISDQATKDNILVVVNTQEILVQGKPVANTAAVLANPEVVVAGILQELRAAKAGLKARGLSDKEVSEHGVTIMGDKEISYALLKKIMATVGEAEFVNISLAVIQKQPAPP